MSDYPDPDEEYELMHADEYELMRETEENTEPNPNRKKAIQAKRSLDFSSPAAKTLSENQINHPPENITNDHLTLTPSLQPVEDVLTPAVSVTKRTVDDLFGDINDIDFDEVGLPSKRQKTEEEVDLELIDKIIEGRRLKQILLEPTGRAQAKKSNYENKDNLSLDIPRWAFLPLTNSDGERVYVKLESEESWETNLSFAAEMPSLHSTYTSVWEEARQILEKKQQEKDRNEALLTQPLPDMDAPKPETKLWVDKYRPRSYVELVTDEPVNRALLHWLHLWDKVVFKKEVKTSEPSHRNSFNKRAGQFQLTHTWKGKKEPEIEIDEDGRPHHKVALLCGPPGVGKTTLAHLLAKLAGYRPVELNASDERSVDAFRNALRSATSMQSVIDKERRPNCLVLDEIDGAPLPTVELLVKWCTASKTEGNKKKVKTQPLRRPVIAICNDLYAPALRPLRPVANIIHVGLVSVPRLASRLAAVVGAAGTGGQVTQAQLSQLARRAAGDVRAAANMLTFLTQQFTIEDIINSNVGLKDCNQNLMQVLQAIFRTNDDPDSSKTVLNKIFANGEYDRVAEGIFENYLQSRVDARLQIACEALSWLRTYDVISAWTLRHQNYSLYAMLPLCAAACHRVLASRNQLKLKYPQQAQEMSRKRTELDSIVLSVGRGSSPACRVSPRALTLDLLPLLPYLLSPELRNPNVQLCSENERKSLRSAAGAMCDYGLQYVQQRTQDGVYAFVMEPDVYRVAFFGTEERVRTSPAIRQAIAREQQLETIRRTEAMSGRVISSQQAAEKAGIPEKPAPARLPNHLQRLKPKELEKSAPQVHKDFFGRIVPVALPSSQRLPDGSRDLISSSSIFYQYREGFNNAVRRAVRMRDLL